MRRQGHGSLAVQTLTEALETLAAGHAGLLWGLVIASVVMLLVSVVAVPWLVLRMPADYYASDTPRPRFAMLPAPLRLPVLLLKNTLGALLLLAGLAMLLLPGQGLLTCLLALALLDFPGKRRAERWLVSRPAVLASLNWLRRRGGRAALRVADESLPPS